MSYFTHALHSATFLVCCDHANIHSREFRILQKKITLENQVSLIPFSFMETGFFVTWQLWSQKTDCVWVKCTWRHEKEQHFNNRIHKGFYAGPCPLLPLHKGSPRCDTNGCWRPFVVQITPTVFWHCPYPTNRLRHSGVGLRASGPLCCPNPTRCHNRCRLLPKDVWPSNPSDNADGTHLGSGRWTKVSTDVKITCLLDISSALGSK